MNKYFDWKFLVTFFNVKFIVIILLNSSTFTSILLYFFQERPVYHFHRSFGLRQDDEPEARDDLPGPNGCGLAAEREEAGDVAADFREGQRYLHLARSFRKQQNSHERQCHQVTTFYCYKSKKFKFLFL